MTTETTDPADEPVTMTRGELKTFIEAAVSEATKPKQPEPPPVKRATDMTDAEYRAALHALRMTGRVPGAPTAPAPAPAAPAAGKNAMAMTVQEYRRAMDEIRMGRIPR